MNGTTPWRRFLLAGLLTVSLFALWGFAHRLYDTLIPPFAKVFGLGSSALVLTQSVYSIVYFFGALPAAMYARNLGYKTTIIFGLGSFAVGSFLFYPAAEHHAFLFFLFAAAVMSVGWIFIEVAANPLVAQSGSPESAAQRLNFAQAFYPLGVLAAVYVGRWIILSDFALPASRLAHAVVLPYIVIGAFVMLLAALVDIAPFPPVATERGDHHDGMSGEVRHLIGRPLFRFAMLAQFAYVAAQAGSWGMTMHYAEAALPGIAATSSADYLFWSLIIYGIGRFAGTLLMSWIHPDRLMAILAAFGAGLAAIAVGDCGPVGMFALAGTSFCMSIMFPTILADAIHGLGPLTKTGTALVYMGGVGGMAGLALMHLIWTFLPIRFTMLVPAAAYVTVLAFAIVNHRALVAREAKPEALPRPA